MKYKMNLIVTDAIDKTEREIEADVKCSVRLVRAKYLKAIAKIEYMGITINDIAVIESRGELKIEYPKKTYTGRDGREKSSSIVFPNMSELGIKFNHIIQQEYSRVAFENSKNPALKVLSSISGDDEDNEAVKMAA